MERHGFLYEKSVMELSEAVLWAHAGWFCHQVCRNDYGLVSAVDIGIHD